MRFGVFASCLLHVSAIGLAFLSLPESWRSKVVSEPVVPIELIREAELAAKTSVPAAAPKPDPQLKPEPAPQPDPPKVAEAKPQPKPEPTKPEPKPEPPKVAEAKPQPKSEPAKPQPKPEPAKPQPKPQPKPSDDLDLDRLAAVVDRTRRDPTPQGQGAAQQQADRPRPQVGAGDRLAASDVAKMKAAVGRCWSVTALAGAPDANRLVVLLQFELNRDGTLSGAPRVANAMQINMSGNRFWKVAEQTAIRALVSCQPYDFLSADRYEVWREMELNFDPSEMAGY